MMKFGMGTRPWAGLDVGTHSVKLVALQPGATRGRYAEATIPRALAGDEPPAPAILAGLIDDCMTRIEETPRSFRGISIGVSGPDVIVKPVTLPWMDDGEIAGALGFEARKHVPFDLSTLVLDHQVLTRHAPEKRLDVLLATVSQQRLERAIAPLRELGVEADIVDAAPLALSNALTQSQPRDNDQEGHVLLDAGHRGSWLTFRHRGLPFFARRLDWGGHALTQAIASATGGSLERAESWKLDAGALLTQESAEATAARASVAKLADEVRRSLAFYGTVAALPSSMSLHVSGGSARLAGFTEVLGERLGLPTLPFSPLDSVDRGVRIQAGGPQYALAYGLALRAV